LSCCVFEPKTNDTYSNIRKGIINIKISIKLFLTILLILYIYGLYRQLTHASTEIGDTITHIILNRAPALEVTFLISGYAYLFRLNIPLLIIIEYIRISNNSNWTKIEKYIVIVIEFFLLITSFIHFKKTEPIIGLISILFLRFFCNKINIYKIIRYLPPIGILPFIITYLFFIPKEEQSIANGFEYISQRVYTYLSLQHLAFDKILNDQIKIEEDNFQFLRISYNRISGLGNTEVTRGDFIDINNFSTNVYSIFGSYYAQFEEMAPFVLLIFVSLLLLILCRFNHMIIRSYLFANLALCFFGNFFEFPVFWFHLIILFLFLILCKSNVKYKPHEYSDYLRKL
jgi:hypothetical protein